MSYKHVGLALALSIAAVGCADESAQIEVGEADLDAVARGIHARVLTVDTHDDIPFDFATPTVDPGVRGGRQVDLPRMREGGLDVAFFVVYVGQGANTAEGFEDAYAQAITKFDAIHRLTGSMYPDEIGLAHSAADVERLHAAGKLVAAIGIENGWPVGDDLSNLATFHALGGRYITLAHNGHNQIADSAQPRADEPAELHGGLSDFGREVVAEMNRLGIMVDVSHVSKNSMLQAAALSAAPVMASHSSCRALCDVARNMDDEQLLALRDNGGVIQIVGLGDFLRTTGPGDPPATVVDLVNHIDYAVDLIGIDHVGISSDFDGGGGVVGWADASETFGVTRELVERGYAEADIAKLWGGNLLRVWREVEAVATSMQAADAD
jgi:membrane dipeptidase